MAHHKSAKKRIRTDLKKRERNKWHLSRVRTAIKTFRKSLNKAGSSSGDSLDDLSKKFREVQSLLAKSCTKGVLHRNNGSRKIKRLHLLLKKTTAQ